MSRKSSKWFAKLWDTRNIIEDRYKTNPQKVPAIRSYLDDDFQITDQKIIEFLEKYKYFSVFELVKKIKANDLSG